ncbi:unnamed protein product [Cutaneotrichosporon oleaginosum]
MLDRDAYPHILDAVISHADQAALRRLRSTTRSICAKADARLCTHLVLKDQASCPLDSLMLLNAPRSWAQSTDSTSEVLTIITPATTTGFVLIPPDKRLAHVRILDVHPPKDCECDRCLGMHWSQTLLEARNNALLALTMDSPPLPNLPLVRLFGNSHSLFHAPPSFLAAMPVRVLHCVSLSSDASPSRLLVYHTGEISGTEIVLNFQYSLQDEGFPYAAFCTSKVPSGRTIIILFTRTEGQWSDPFPSRRQGQPRVLNTLAYYVVRCLRAPSTLGREDRVVLVGSGDWNPAWLAKAWGRVVEYTPVGVSVEERFRWWVRALADDDAQRVESGIAYASYEELKAYIGDEEEYTHIIAP